MSLGQQIQLRKLVRHLLVILLVAVWANFSSLVLDFLIEPAVKDYKLFTLKSGPSFLKWLMAWPIFLILMLFTVFPVWRFAHWLNAITYQEVREVDLKRVIIWINCIQGLLIFSAVTAFIGMIASLFMSWKTLKIEDLYNIWILIYILINIISLRFIKIWAREMTLLQYQPENRSRILMPIVNKATPYFRFLQILSFLEAILHFSSIYENSIPTFMLLIISSGLNIYILELGLRFAHFTAQDNLFSSPKTT